MTRKLVTPVTYEPDLDDLNEPRPLSLVDEVQRRLTLAAAGVEPGHSKRPGSRLVACDSTGNVGAHQNGNDSYIGYGEYILWADIITPDYVTIDFGHHVTFLVVYDAVHGMGNVLERRNNGDSLEYIYGAVGLQRTVSGQVFYFVNWVFDPMAVAEWHMLGFYKE